MGSVFNLQISVNCIHCGNFHCHQCIDWYPLKEFLGCVNTSKDMKGLCEEMTIDSMFILEEKIYVFHLNNYWIFELNFEDIEQPLGVLVEGKVDISSKWKDINISKSKLTIHDNKLVAITDNEWKQFETDGSVGATGLILDERDVEVPVNTEKPSEIVEQGAQTTESGVDYEEPIVSV